MWQFGSDEAIMVTALYPRRRGSELHLLAFSPGGGIIDDWSLDLSGGDVTEGGSWDALRDLLSVPFQPGIVFVPPLPGVAIATSPQGGTPHIVLVDRYFRQTIRFTFCVGASCVPPVQPGFTELFRTPHQPRDLWSAPMIMPDMRAVVGTDDGVVFNGPGPAPSPPVTGLGAGIYATPTMAAIGSLVVVSVRSRVSVLRDGAVVSWLPLQGETIARAAASRSHVYVSTTEALYTLDANAADSSVLRFPWAGGGGRSSPAIGPRGQVYAMASNVLFVFPAPRTHGDPTRDLEDLRGGVASGSGRGTN
jgi:hypothetical protein